MYFSSSFKITSDVKLLGSKANNMVHLCSSLTSWKISIKIKLKLNRTGDWSGESILMQMERERLLAIMKEAMNLS